jgi:hypothetical protein
MKDTLYICASVRTDLPSHEQICVQATHAGIEAGTYFGDCSRAEPYTLLLFEAPNEEGLRFQLMYLDSKGINYRYFVEPDQGFKMTAWATEPLTREEKDEFFSRFKLLKFSNPSPRPAKKKAKAG